MLNPEYYDTYIIAGDYSTTAGDFDQAKSFYKTALTKEIATEAEKRSIISKINKKP